jgi:hypothetical protein
MSALGPDSEELRFSSSLGNLDRFASVASGSKFFLDRRSHAAISDTTCKARRRAIPLRLLRANHA